MFPRWLLREKVMNGFMRSVMETVTPYGSAALWHLGQMGLLIKMGEMVVCVDYYGSEADNRRFAPPVPAWELEGVDAFLGTHNHLDHIDHASWRIWKDACPGAVFIFPQYHMGAVLADGIEEERCIGMSDGTVCRIGKSDGTGSRIGMDDGPDGHVGSVKVTSIPAAHEFLEKDPVTGLYPHLQYIIEGNGVRIYHAGDTVRYEGMRVRLQEFGVIDAAILPINGRDGIRLRRDCIGNMTFQEAVDLAGELKVRYVIPGHWDLFADNSGDPDAFADYLDAKYPGQTVCIVPEKLERVLIGAEGR